MTACRCGWMRAVLSRSTRAAVVGAALIGQARAQVAASTTTATTTATTAAAAASPATGMMQGLVGLVIVIGLIFAAGWVMKKIGPRASAGGLVQVVGGTSVGPREKVVVVRFGGRTLLLGVAPGQVSLLDATDTVDVVDTGTPSGTSPPTFVERLRAARGGA